MKTQKALTYKISILSYEGARMYDLHKIYIYIRNEIGHNNFNAEENKISC